MGDLETNASNAPEGQRYLHQNLLENITMLKIITKKNRIKNWVAKRMVLICAKLIELISSISPRGLIMSSTAMVKNDITGKIMSP
jgi:hypothetical protein